MSSGVAVLQRGSPDEMVGGCHFHGVRFYFGSGSTLQTRYKTFRFQSPGLGQRRKVLDQALITSAAATPGVQVHIGVRVDGLIRERDTATGFLAAGQEYRAPLGVAADGAQSIIRKQLGLNDGFKRARFGVRAHFRLADAKPQAPWVEVFIENKIEIYATPLRNREILVALLAEVGTFRGSTKAEFLSLCRSFPALADRLEGAEQITQLMGATPISGNTRHATTLGAVLLGDAAGYADPVTGTGMTQALITAEPLTKHLVRRKKVDAAWSRPFEQQRRAILGKWYGTRCYVALTKTESCPISVGRSRSLVFPRVKFNSGGRPEQTHVR